jgi:putative transposase
MPVSSPSCESLPGTQRLDRLEGILKCIWIISLGVPPPSLPVEMELRDEMQRVAFQFPSYGHRRITAELNRRGFAVNHKRVLRLMRQDIAFAAALSLRPAVW